MHTVLTLATLVVALATTIAPAFAQTTTPTNLTATEKADKEKEKAAKELLDRLVELDEKIDDQFDKSSSATSGLAIPEGVFALGEPKRDGRQVGNVNLFLIRAHDLYRNIKKGTKCKTDDPRTLCGHLSDLDDLSHRLLSERGLGWSMAAIVRAGLMIGDAGDGADKTFARNELVSKNFGAAYVDFELPHWGDGLGLVDATVTGHFGYAPVAALVRERPASTNASPNKITALFMPGYNWGTDVRLNFQLAKSELSVVASTGADRLTDLTIKLGADDKAAIADVLRNDVGRWGWRHGGAVEYRYYGADLDFVHHDASRLLTPRFSLGVGVQYATRFKPIEDLDGFGSTARLNMRVSVNIVEWVRDTAKVGKSNDPLTVRMVFESDHPLSKSDLRVPSGNRLYIEANADLLKAFGFGEDKPAGAAAAAPTAPGTADAKTEGLKKPGF